MSLDTSLVLKSVVRCIQRGEDRTSVTKSCFHLEQHSSKNKQPQMPAFRLLDKLYQQVQLAVLVGRADSHLEVIFDLEGTNLVASRIQSEVISPSIEPAPTDMGTPVEQNETPVPNPSLRSPTREEYRDQLYQR